MAFDKGKHVMLSYNHKSKNIVKAVYNSLIAENIPVWYDERDMEGNMFDSMAGAVSDASVVCCFLTPEYENSPMCKLELQHAQKLRKRIIPCMVSDRKIWKPSTSKWLDLITGSILAINFSDTSEGRLLTQIKNLIDEIRNESPNEKIEPILSSPVSLFESIKEKYLQENKIKRIVNEEKSVQIEQSYINLAIVETKEQQDKEKELKQQKKDRHEADTNEEKRSDKSYNPEILSTYEEIYGAKVSIDVENIFQSCKDPIKKLLVLGRAGIGKSTFCQYVTYRWAKGEIWSDYVQVILIHLRQLTDTRYPPVKNYSPIDLVEKEYFTFDDISEKHKQLFKEQCKKGQVLWILDGYDEFSQSIPTQLKDVFDHIRETQHHILTSRPYAIALAYDVKMEIIGFTNENIEKYIKQFFNHIKNEILNSSFESQKLLRFLKLNPSIWGVAHIPVNLELICSLWSDTDLSETRILTMTILYDNIVEWLCRRYLTRQSIKHENMTKQNIYKQCESELKYLEHLAFAAMERNQIIISPSLLEEVENEINYSALLQHPQMLNIGILKSYDEKSVGNQLYTKKQHYFVHLSFQEHFAARHLLNMINSSHKQKAIQFIHDNKYNQRFHFVFIFASGLLSNSNFHISHREFWKAIQEEPLDLVGLRHAKLIIECIDQLIHTTVFSERAFLLNWISHLIPSYIIDSKKLGKKHILESLERATSLTNTTILQNKFIELLKTDDQYVVKETLLVISRLDISNPTERLLLTLSKLIHHEDSTISSTACQVLSNMGDRAATNSVIAALAAALGDEASSVRKIAGTVLANMSESIAQNDVIIALVNLIGDDDVNVRRRVCEAIGDMGEKIATNELITTLINTLYDEDSGVRQKACEAIGKIGRKAATNEMINALVNVLKHDDRDIHKEACYALGQMGEKAATTQEVITVLIIALHDQNSVVQSRACEAIGKIGQTTQTPQMMAAFVDALQDENLGVRKRMFEVVITMCKKAATNEVITVLARALWNEDSEICKLACQALCVMGANPTIDKVITSLVNTLRHEDFNIRSRAVKVLNQMAEIVANYEEQIASNNRFMRYLTSGSAETRNVCDEADDKPRTNQIVITLMNAIHDEDPDVRRSVCEAIGHMGKNAAATNEVANVLVGLMEDNDLNVRQKACVALEKMGDTVVTDKTSFTLVDTVDNQHEVITALLDVLHNDNNILHEKAFESFAKLVEMGVTDVVVVPLLNALRDEDRNVRRTVCKIIGKIGKKIATNEIISALAKALQDEDSGVRLRVCEILGNIGQTAAKNEVITALILALQDPNSDVRRSVCETIRKMGEKVATNKMILALANALQDHDSGVRRRVCDAIYMIGKKAGTKEIIAALVNILPNAFTDFRQTCEGLGNFGVTAVSREEMALKIIAFRKQDTGVYSRTCDVLRMIGEKAATNQVLCTLLDLLGDLNNQVLRMPSDGLIYSIIHFYTALKDLDSNRIKKLYYYVKQFHSTDWNRIASDQFINLFISTENESWIPFIVFSALSQGIAVTITDGKILVYDSKGVSELPVLRLDLIDRLIGAFGKQLHEIEGTF